MSLLLAPLIVKLLRFISSRVKVLMKHCQESFAEVLGRIKQVYDGHRLVKLSDTYEYELGRFHSINDTMRRMLLEMTKVSSLGTPLNAGDLHVGRRRRAGLRHVPDELGS